MVKPTKVPLVSSQLVLQFRTHAELEALLVDNVRALGYSCVKNPWTRASEVAKQFDLEQDTALARVKAFIKAHPDEIQVRRDTAGHLIEFRMTTGLSAWLSRPLVRNQPCRKP